MDPMQKSNALCLKRKPVDDCLAKNSKSGRVEKENASSKPAHNCHSQPNLANDCVNYLKCGVPNRVVFYRQGSWCDFPDKVVKSIVDAFKEDKSSVVVVMDDQPLLVDFLSMTLVNLKTRKQRSVAWLDGTNKWSLPSSFFDEEVDESTRLGTGVGKGGAQGVVGGNVMKPPSDVAKQVMLEASPPVLQNSSALNVLLPNNILHIHRYSPKDITAQCRLEAFERLMRLTGQKSGTAIARYGWLGSGKQDIVSVITNGLLSTEKITHETEIGAGIYLSPENRAFTSVGFCDVDEKGVQHMLLCRAILGNTGVIKPEENKITRDEMVKRMMIIVGEKLLLDTLTKLKYSPSLWYNSSEKMVSSPASTTPESVSIWTRNMDVESATPSHDGPVNSTFGGPPVTNAALKGQHSPTLSICSESSSPQYTNSQDPLAPAEAPLGHDALVRSALLGVNVWDAAGQRMQYNGHDLLSRSSSRGHDSDVSRPTHGNSSSPSMEGLHSVAPSMTPEAHGPLAPSKEHGNSSLADAQGIVAATPGVVCQAPQLSAAKSMEPELSAPRSMAPYLSPPRSMAHHLRGKAFRELGAPTSMAPHLSAPRSMAPHLRDKMPEVPEKTTMPEAHYSSAATVVPVILEPLSSSPLPKENSFVTSCNECLTPSSVQQGPDCPSNLATTPRNTPNLKNVDPTNPAAQCGEKKNFPIIGVDDSSMVAYAAGTLITLSSAGDKGP
ncbi:hypothetical protein ACQ4PT_009353 [Festuca glaucescens]